MSAASDLDAITEQVARFLWGEPNDRHTKPGRELRWGSSGSKSFDVRKSTVYDFEREAGGGVLWLIEAELGLKGAAAFQWLRANGFEVGDKREGGERPQRAERPAPAPRREELRPPPKPDSEKFVPEKKLTATYDYTDMNGAVVMQVCRYEWQELGATKKTFRQRRPFRDGYAWGVRGGPYYRRGDDWLPAKDASGSTVDLPELELVPYHVADLQEAIGNGWTVFVVEGEKDADRLRDLGVPATCNPMGAGKWPENFKDYFVGADVVVIPDNDEPGENHAALVARSLEDSAKRIRILRFLDIPAKGDASDWLDRGGDLDRLYTLAEQAPDAGAPDALPFISKFGAIQWKDMGKPRPPYQWLIKNLLPGVERCLIYGEPQSGKSFAALDMAMCIAQGIPYQGRKTQHRGVVYCAFEGGKGFAQRVTAYKLHHGLEWEQDFPFTLLTRNADLFSSDVDADNLIAEIQHWATTYAVPLGLVVLDTYSACTPGMKENASEDVSRVLSRVRRILESCGATVLVVHHKPKGGETPRGHGSLTGDFECTIDVRFESEDDTSQPRRREMNLTKQREGETGAIRTFVLRGVKLGYDEDEDPIYSCVVDDADGDTGPSVRMPDVKMSTNNRLAWRALMEALGRPEAKRPPPSELGLPNGVAAAVERRIWRYEYARLTGEGGDDLRKAAASSKVDNAIDRAVKDFLVRGWIGNNGGWVWVAKNPFDPVPQPRRNSENRGGQGAASPSYDADDSDDFY